MKTCPRCTNQKPDTEFSHPNIVCCACRVELKPIYNNAVKECLSKLTLEERVIAIEKIVYDL